MKTSKKKSAYNQIVAAIAHFHEGELDCAITLAAAEGMLSSDDDRYLFKALRDYPEAKDIDFNLVINWLKHQGGPESVNLTEFEAAIAIARAMTKFNAAHHQSSERFQQFLRQVYEGGILPIDLDRNSN